MSNGTVEMIGGRERRRWKRGEKLRIVAETQEPGACTAGEVCADARGGSGAERMIAPQPGVRVWLAAGVTDMCKGFDGLRPWCSSISGRIRSAGSCLPSAAVVVLVKVLSWDGQGLCPYTTRLA
jgi:hypothetical protein